jgi:hypothetical protein
MNQIYNLGIPRRRCKDNIKIDLRDIGLGGMDWIDLAQDRGQWRALVNTVMNLRIVGFEVFTAVVNKSIIFWAMTPCSPLSCTRRFVFFDPEDGGDTFLRNVRCNSTDYTASYPRR